MYNKVDTNMNFVEREKATEQFWKAKMPAEVNGIVNRADHQIRR